jgi:hypothetical protein
MPKLTVVLVSVIMLQVYGWSQNINNGFSNPLLPSGADPWSIYKDGFYYYTHTLGNRIDIWKTKDLVC